MIIEKKENKQYCLITKLGENIIESFDEDVINNSVPKIKKTIKSSTNKEEIKSCFLRKRSGDWLQVLSCLDKERKYLIQGNVKNLTDCIIYFCSADRIALSFALCCGVNCLIKQEGVYFVYKANEIEFPATMNPFDKQRIEASSMFQYVRNEKLEETINILKEGLRESEALKTEWEAILNTVDTTNSLDKLKELLILALHYCTLYEFGDTEKQDIIKQFIENPYNEIFTNSSNQWIITNYTQKYPIVIRRYKYLNKFSTSEREEYYKVFKFENSSFDSRDMIYGCVLFRKLLNTVISSSKEFIVKFTIKIMERVIELVKYDENIISLYTHFFEVYNLYNQYGGGSKYKMSLISHAMLVKNGDYIIKHMLAPTSEFRFILSDEFPYSLSTTNLGEEMINYLIYQKNIIPRDYLAYVTEMNEEYEEEGEKGPYYEIKEFLKRRIQLKTRALKNLRTARKHRNYIIQQRNIKTRRRMR